jgi:hypothetical protein
MGTKKNRGGSGKIIAKREQPVVEEPKKAAPAAAAPAKPRMPERIQEKDAGFGAIKVVAGIIVALIVGVMVLTRFSGGDAAERGDSGQDERCQNTQECKAGYVCQAHRNDAERCLKLCEVKNPQSCDPGYQCEPAAKQAGRKKMRLIDVCIPNAKAK